MMDIPGKKLLIRLWESLDRIVCGLLRKRRQRLPSLGVLCGPEPSLCIRGKRPHGIR